MPEIDALLNSTILVIVIAIMGLVVIINPYMGLAFTVASQSIVDVLPTIPGFTSFVPLIGLVTVAGFIIQAGRRHIKGAFKFYTPHIFGLVFIFWFFVTNPSAAWSGVDRNWFFTYAQLWVLMWLSSFMINTPKKQQVLMWIFTITTVITAIAIFNRGGFLEEIDPTIRAAGFTQGANTAARYFIISFVFLYYLRTTVKSTIWRTVSLVGMIIIFLAVYYTVSRTGMVLLAIAIILIFLLNPRMKNRVQIIIIAVIAFTILLIFSSSILQIIGEIVPTVRQGTDTMGLRYALWEAGWEMWKDHPLFGVGMGMFPSTLKYYPNPTYSMFFMRGLVAHNTYVAILAETGLIGFILFSGLLISVVHSLLKSRKKLDEEWKPIANVWLIVMIILLIGGITKTDQAEKILWLTMGVITFVANQTKTTFSKNHTSNTKTDPKDKHLHRTKTLEDGK